MQDRAAGHSVLFTYLAFAFKASVQELAHCDHFLLFFKLHLPLQGAWHLNHASAKKTVIICKSDVYNGHADKINKKSSMPGLNQKKSGMIN